MATRKHQDEAIRITTAPENPREDLNRRRKRYVASMTMRTICFVCAIAVPITWLRIVFVAGALILPYVAVVMANSASPRIPGTDLVDSGSGYRELE